MPNNQDTLVDKLEDIGDAIRAKTGKSDKLTLSQMPTEIGSISGGGDTYLDWYKDQVEDSAGSTAATPHMMDIDFDMEIAPAGGFSLFGQDLGERYIGINSLNLPNLKYIPERCFYYLYQTSADCFPTKLSFPSVEDIKSNAFNNIGNSSYHVSNIDFLSLTTLTPNPQPFTNMFVDNWYLPKLNSGISTTSIGLNNAKNVYIGDNPNQSKPIYMGGNTASRGLFSYNNVVEKLIIDIPKAGFSTCPVELRSYLTSYTHNNSSNRFYNGSAKIYVPKNILALYENATNWSIYYAVGNILAIEDSETDLKGIFPQLDEKMGW